jgi:hypothetical protein
MRRLAGAALVLALATACGRAEPSSGSAAAHASSRRAARAPAPSKPTGGASDEAIEQRIVQGVAEGKRVMLTVHLEARPGEPAKDHHVRVKTVEFGGDGAVKTLHLDDRGVDLSLPLAGFRKVLVKNAPITVDGSDVR